MIKLSLQLLGKLKPLLVVLGWGTSTAGLMVGGIFLGTLLPQFQGGGDLLPEIISRGPWLRIILYLGVLGISILASLVMADFSKSVLAFFVSYALAAIITFVVLALPAFVGAFPPPDLLVPAAINFTFGAFFPIVLFIQLLGTIIGATLASSRE